MHKFLAGTALLCLISTAAMAQGGKATIILNSDVQKVLKSKAGDHTIKVVDMGGYQESVAVVNRGPTGQPPQPGAAAAAAAAAAKAEPCGLSSAPAGARLSTESAIAHDDTAETYIVIAGSGTLFTGGQIVNGRRSAPDSEVTKVLNGPSCSGRVIGNVSLQKMNVGDIAVIPAGVPHGWTDIATGVTYLSVRPDPKKVLPAGYVFPTLRSGGK